MPPSPSSSLALAPPPHLRLLISGGARGIGRAIAEAFHAYGAKIAILDRESVAAAPPAWLCLQGSVSDPAAVAMALEAAVARWGGIDVAVANAGIAMNKPTLELSLAEWQHTLDVNLTGAFLLAQAAGRLMVAQGAGLILFTASIYGLLGGSERAAYCASKAGIANLARALACEWGHFGVRVNAIAPGYTETQLVSDLLAAGRLAADALTTRAPLHRLVQPAEVAALACFLASPAAAAITGAVVPIDAGWSANGAP